MKTHGRNRAANNWKWTDDTRGDDLPVIERERP
jgi:hypothetical protein